MSRFQQIFDEADELCGLPKSVPIPQEDTTQFEAAYNLEENRKQLFRNQLVISDLEKLRGMIQRIALPREDDRFDSIGDESDPNHVVLGCYTKKLIFPANVDEKMKRLLDQSTVKQPYYDWEQEVRDAMKVEDSLSSSNEVEEDDVVKTSSSSFSRPRRRKASSSAPSRTHLPTIFAKVHKFEVDIAPYQCFDTEYIDVENIDDPLDRVFPNYSSYPTIDDESEEDDDEDVPVAKETPEPLKTQDINTVQKVSAQQRRENLFKRFTKTEQDQVEDQQELDYLLLSPDDEARQQKVLRDKQRLQEKIQRIKGVDTWLDTSTSLIKNTAKRTRDIALHSRIPAMIASFNHSSIALSHYNTRPDLKEIELKYFHRPRMVKEKDRSWQISLKQRTSINRRLKGGQNELGKIVLAEEDKQNLSLLYKDSVFIILEYIEEFPPIMLNYGMASCIINYFRSSNETAQEIDEANEAAGSTTGNSSSSADPNFLVNLHKRKMARTSGSGHKNESALETIKKQLQESNCRLPRHVLLLWELNNTKRSYEHDANIPRQKIGSTKVLSPEDASPFLGNIEVGELQKSFENNLFRSPLYEHSVSPTDFLLIRTKTSNSLLSFSIREIPHIFLSGQLEPQVIVPRPHHKYTPIQEKFYLLSIIRKLQSNVHGIAYQELYEAVLKYCSKEILTPHKYYHRQHFKDLLKRVGDEIRETNNPTNIAISRWFYKEFNDPELENQYSADTIAKNFTPEEVCVQESSNAAEYRLLQSNITDLELMKIQIYLHFLHQYKQYQRERLENLHSAITEIMHKVNYASAVSSNSSSSTFSPEQVEKMQQTSEHLKKIFIQEIHRTDVKQSIARFILERLITAPWNTTEAFVNSVIKGDNSGKMNVRGKGDPSGIGEAFAYVRLPNVQSTLLSPAALKKKKEDEKESNKLVGTDKDLRVLTKKDAIDLLTRLGVKKEEATKLGRWDRIHMIRSMVNELGEKGLLDENEKGLIKFARDPTLMNKIRKGGDAAGAVRANGGMSGLDISIEEFKKICNEIWNRQKAVLMEGTPLSQQRHQQHLVTSPSHHARREARKREKKKLRRQESILGSPRSPVKRSNSNDDTEMDQDHSPSEEETDSDDDSDDSDLAEDIEKALSNRTRMVSSRLEADKSQSTKQYEQDKLEFQSFNTLLDKNSQSVIGVANRPATANNLSIDIPNKEKKKKITVGITGGNNEGATPRTTSLPSDSTALAPSSSNYSNHAPANNMVGPSSSSSSSNLPSIMQIQHGTGPNLSFKELQATLPVNYQYPPKVVKKVTRTTLLDGKEIVKVEFIFVEPEVQRIQALAEKAKRDRMERRTITALSQHPYCNKLRGTDGNYLDSDEEFLASNPTMSLQVGKLRQTIDHHHHIQTIQSNLPLSKKEKQLTIKTQKAMAKAQQAKNDDEIEFVSKVKSTKRSSLSQFYMNARLPRVTFAIRLEKEIMTIWNKKEAELFRYPVDRAYYPQYYNVIQQPICLSDIREKVVRYQYESLEQFLNDVKLMAENSEKFNGKINAITDMARKIYNDLKLSIDHEKQMISHPQVDFFTRMEEMMRQKKAFYRRGLHDLAGVGGSGNSSSAGGVGGVGVGGGGNSSVALPVNPSVIGGGFYR